MKPSNGQSNGKHSAIWTLREQKGMSQRELAEASGISRGRLRHLENGRFEEVTLEELKRMAGILNVDVRDVLSAGGETRLGVEHRKAGEATFRLDLPQSGCRIASHHAPHPDFFNGRIFLAAQKRIPSEHVPKALSVMIQVVLGELRIELRQGIYEIKEGDSLVFPGDMPYTIENPSIRDSFANLITVPSFLVSSLGRQSIGEKAFAQRPWRRFLVGVQPSSRTHS